MTRSLRRPSDTAATLRRVEPSDVLVDAVGLSVTYGVATGSTVRAVQDAAFTVRRGERLAIVGESGSGKTSLGMAIAGFAVSTGATIEAQRFTFAGEALNGKVRRRSRLPKATPGVSMVFQNAMTSLDPVWSIGSQFVWALKRTTNGRREALGHAREWLRRVGLDDTERVLRARPYELSGGMRQRVMVALALCGRPQLVIADEPTSALDASLSRVVMKLLHDLTEEMGSALLMITHDIGLCQQFSDRVVVMYQGVLVDDLPAADLAANARHPYTVGLLQCIPTFENVDADRLPTLRDFVADTPDSESSDDEEDVDCGVA